HIAPQQSHLTIGQCGAEARHNIIDAFLEWNDAVEITFDKDRKTLIANFVLRVRESEEVAPLCVDGSLGRIEILGFACFNDSPTESNHSALRVGDRKDDSTAKAIVKTARVFQYCQPAVVDLISCSAPFSKMICERLPAIGGVAEPE